MWTDHLPTSTCSRKYCMTPYLSIIAFSYYALPFNFVKSQCQDYLFLIELQNLSPVFQIQCSHKFSTLLHLHGKLIGKVESLLERGSYNRKESKGLVKISELFVQILGNSPKN